MQLYQILLVYIKMVIITCFQVEIVLKCTLEMFAKVPPIGRCTKQLTSQRWILPCNRVVNVWEEMKSLFNT